MAETAAESGVPPPPAKVFGNSEPAPEFSVCIVVCDHYLMRPIPGIDVIYSDFRGSDIKLVPVLRIFGSAPDGHKACLHVHGVFPYFYIPCPSSNPEPQFLYQIAASLDKALNIALKQATSANQHVYKISLVKGLPFYGFHDKHHLYLKVFLYNPGLIKQAVELCSNGAILGQTFQPHESHLNFTLQFFIDFNLFGLSNIDLQTVKFRRSGTSQNSNELDNLDDNYLKPESICYYEADCTASHIVNRQRVGKGDGIENPGIEEVWNQEKERRKQLNISMASKSLSQSRINDETESHYKFEQMILVKISDLIDKPVNIDPKNQIREELNAKNEAKTTFRIPEVVHYPAESLEASQLSNAVDVTIHLPDSSYTSLYESRREFDETLVGDADDTIVDENVALNSSLHYSQVILNSEDLDLLNMLQDMDEPVEDDSMIATQAEVDADVADDDAEYSQVFNEDTILMEPYDSKDDNDTEESSPMWNDSFWEGANIPQLDGTCDDDHVKKVRKRKMRPFKLGLARPKNKRKVDEQTEINESTNNTETDEIEINESTNNTGTDEIEINEFTNNTETDEIEINESTNNTGTDEINASRETIDRIPEAHIKRSVKKEPRNVTSIAEDKIKSSQDINSDDSESNDSIMDLVNKFTIKYERETNDVKSETYDLHNEYVPVAGPSTSKHYLQNEFVHFHGPSTTKRDGFKIPENDGIDKEFVPKAGPSTARFDISKIDEKDGEIDKDFNDSSESSPEVEMSKSGILSFYDMSKVFDVTLENYNDVDKSAVKSQDEIMEEEPMLKSQADKTLRSQNEHFPLDFRETVKSQLKLTDKNESPNSSNLVLTPRYRPPTKKYIEETLQKYNIPKVKNLEPYYSDHKDVGDKFEIGLMLLKLQSKVAKDQKPFEKVLNTTSIEEWRQLTFLENNELCENPAKPEVLKTLLAGNRQCILQPVLKPPKRSDVEIWLQKDKTEIKDEVVQTEMSRNIDELDNSQAIGLNEHGINSSISLEASDKDNAEANASLQVTMHPDGSFLCFNNGDNQTVQKVNSQVVEVDFLTVMLVEVHTSVRGDLHPDPAIDAIQAIFVSVTNDCPNDHFLNKNITEIIVVDHMSPPKSLDRCVFGQKISYVENESEILEKIIELVKKHDPDIMCGFEIEMTSWGYILERAQNLGLEIVREFSRITEKNRQKRWRNDENDFEGRIIGRIMFNVWRLFRHELALSSYSFENCMYEILKERVPKYSYAQLSECWNDESRILRWIPVEYYLTRLSGTVSMLEKLDIINRTSELARLFGLQWWEVVSRGSQFRVESLMLRATRPLNLIALSPTVRQRAAMKAPECLPLIFEPESRFYSDPVIVLDFQSLYPSMMIAYNYCFSTCIGRVHNITGDTAYEFGAWRLRIPTAKLETVIKNGLVHYSPVGVGFIKPSVRRGVLPALLTRILAARQAVKKGMKLQTDPAVKKAMHSRQLGLKLIANVTYGYTAANFSGRMPCVEVADSVVAKGRETLERAIKMVRDTKRWNAKVVYGDTDSMFVLVRGGTRAEAFAIGQQIADAVTADNPHPVALKLEKVYQPCILQTKKRYVGYMYESADQLTPVYEAKGIETVRRDGCPAGVKLLQRSLCELFEHGDMSRVKRVVTATLSRLAHGCMPPHELFFTREYHGANGYKASAAAPPRHIANRIQSRDRRAGPRPGQRVPWLVTAGPPGAPLVRLARTPEELARDPSLTPHVTYYAARVLLPPLHRCLSLLGANVFKWWTDLGYTQEAQQRDTRGGIARYMWRNRCAFCGERNASALCQTCAGTQHAAAILGKRLADAERNKLACSEICSSCCGHQLSSSCVNTECPVLWRRITANHKLEETNEIFSHLPANGACQIEF